MRYTLNFCVSTTRWWMMSLFVCLLFISCEHVDQKPAASSPGSGVLAETPKALEEGSSGDVGSFSRGHGDLLEDLYQEIVKKDARLQAVEGLFKKLSEKKADSTEAFGIYEDKSDRYYSSAVGLVAGVKDTILQQKMGALIAGSDSAYRKLTGKHLTLLAGIKGKEQSLEDLHITLKLTRTLPLIESYQKNHLPGVGSLQNMLNEYERAVEKTADLRVKK